jgi:hypothetical protein
MKQLTLFEISHLGDGFISLMMGFPAVKKSYTSGLIYVCPQTIF